MGTGNIPHPAEHSAPMGQQQLCKGAERPTKRATRCAHLHMCAVVVQVPSVLRRGAEESPPKRQQRLHTAAAREREVMAAAITRPAAVLAGSRGLPPGALCQADATPQTA